MRVAKGNRKHISRISGPKCFLVTCTLLSIILAAVYLDLASRAPPAAPASSPADHYSASTERHFKDIATETGTDKVAGNYNLAKCLQDREQCGGSKSDQREECRPFGHFYDTIYDRWLKQYSTDDADPFQFLEIGFFNGKGFEAYTKFLPRGEKHSMEIACIAHGPRSEGKWPWDNFAIKHPQYKSWRAARRLHCGDASDYNFLVHTWKTEMKRPDAPPLKIVIDDASHLSEHMATSLFFWIPRIEPGGVMVVEDIQPTSAANKFRTHILPQAMKDLHWCGSPSFPDTFCFPTISPFIGAIHCELHICVFVRNDKPAIEPRDRKSVV